LIVVVLLLSATGSVDATAARGAASGSAAKAGVSGAGPSVIGCDATAGVSSVASIEAESLPSVPSFAVAVSASASAFFVRELAGRRRV
jgi:hypothetical protein